MDKAFVGLHLDPRMISGKELIKKVRGERRDGIPWMVILDSTGKELITSDGPNGNVGCPITEPEVGYFMEMVGQAAGKRLGSDDKAELRKLLWEFGKKYRR